MRANGFRYRTLLEVFQNQEDFLMEEISGLEKGKKAVGHKVQHLSDKWQEAQEMLSKGKNGCDVGATLHYLEGLLGWIQDAKSRQILLDKAIIERRDEVQKIRTERKRFGKLKERHVAEWQKFARNMEQKVTDEFAQRKKNL